MGLPAQEVLTTDAGLPSKPMLSSQKSMPIGSALRITTLTLPFFDDFSADAVTPDTNRWAMHPLDVRRPSLSVAKGHKVPSKGVATFDGATVNGAKYANAFSSGIADTLASMPIDLTGLVPADSVYLSFFVQRGGAGEAPEADDSLVVLFDAVGDYSYEQVWVLKGTGAAESNFIHYFILLDDAKYFHNAFRFKFVSFASLNGELDQFHLDYVQLGANRSRTDTQLNDVSPQRMVTSPIGPYTAMPRKQYQRSAPTTGTSMIVANAGDPASNAVMSLSLDDAVGGNVFAGTTIVSANASLFGFGHDSVNATAFSDQAAQMQQYGSLRVTALKASPGDLHPENDTLRTVYAIDSTLAYDDGVGDFGYGLTTARAFCQQYDIDRPDTMVAVWIHFAPTLHYNQQINLSTDLAGKGFRLVVWDSLSVDSSLIETSGGMNVDYGNAPNTFIRYPLIREVEVPTRFWVGLRQSDGMAIGLALDRSDTTRRIYYENNVAEFQRSTNRGALMIRPEFRLPNALVAAPEAQAPSPLAWRIAPNPVHAPEIGIALASPAGIRSISFVLYDLQGRNLREWDGLSPAAAMQLPIADMPASGLYWLRVSAVDHRGRTQIDTQKLLIQPH
jgi:hypothetical protein